MESLEPRSKASGWMTWWSLTRGAIASWIDDGAPSMGAALSYYTVFSLAPLLFIVISVAGLVFGEEAARGEVFVHLTNMMGAQAASGVQQMLASFDEPAKGISGAVIGAVALVIGATTVFAELQNALDRIWRTPKQEGGSGIWLMIRSRLLSFGLVLALGFLLMVSLLFSSALSALSKWYGGFFGDWEILGRSVDVVVGFVLTTTAFALIYKLMPRASVGWKDVWVGATVTALLFTLGRVLIGLYIGRAGVADGFGAAAGVIVVFAWVYYSAQIFLIGAEFTWVYSETFGTQRSLTPSDAQAPSTPSDKPGQAGLNKQRAVSA
ncbi:MAG: YihY/virulence factor BrkB family protein [Burkholderiaceae bacterium]